MNRCRGAGSQGCDNRKTTQVQSSGWVGRHMAKGRARMARLQEAESTATGAAARNQSLQATACLLGFGEAAHTETWRAPEWCGGRPQQGPCCCCRAKGVGLPKGGLHVAERRRAGFDDSRERGFTSALSTGLALPQCGRRCHSERSCVFSSTAESDCGVRGAESLATGCPLKPTGRVAATSSSPGDPPAAYDGGQRSSSHSHLAAADISMGDSLCWGGFFSVARRPPNFTRMRKSLPDV